MRPRVDARLLPFIQRAFDQYETAVEDAPLTDLTKQTYMAHARLFVRWMEGSFDPGQRKDEYVRRRD